MNETTCKSCWWVEGSKCYEGEVDRDSNGISKKLAEERCEKYWNKRHALSTVIPSEMLIIVSETTTNDNVN